MTYGESPHRHDIIDLDGGYISINRPKDAPPLTEEQQAALRDVAEAALKHIDGQLGAAASLTTWEESE